MLVQQLLNMLPTLSITSKDNMYHLKLYRQFYEDKQTRGSLVVYHNSTPVKWFKSLELPWRDNERFVSCIPVGVYLFQHYWSPSFEEYVLLLENVDDRDKIEIHPGNTFMDIAGCILPGMSFKDVDNDGNIDVRDSRESFRHLMRYFDNPSIKYQIEII